jgi:hypothetical protein
MILTGNLPRYQEVSDSPPNYEIFWQGPWNTKSVNIRSKNFLPDFDRQKLPHHSD